MKKNYKSAWYYLISEIFNNNCYNSSDIETTTYKAVEKINNLYYSDSALKHSLRQLVENRKQEVLAAKLVTQILNDNGCTIKNKGFKKACEIAIEKIKGNDNSEK